jgi:hypothetical protein
VSVRPSAERPQVSAARVAAQRQAVPGSELAQRAAQGLRALQVEAEAVREQRVSRGTHPAGVVGRSPPSAEPAAESVVPTSQVRPRSVSGRSPRAEVRPLASAEAQRSKRQAAMSARQVRVVPERPAFAVPRGRTRRTAMTPLLHAAVRPRASSPVRSPEAETPPARGTAARRPVWPTRVVRASADRFGKYPYAGHRRHHRIIRSAPPDRG